MSGNASDNESYLDKLEKNFEYDDEDELPSCEENKEKCLNGGNEDEYNHNDNADDDDHNENTNDADDDDDGASVNKNECDDQEAIMDDDIDNDELEDGTIYMDAEGNYFYQRGKKAAHVKPVQRVQNKVTLKTSQESLAAANLKKSPSNSTLSKREMPNSSASKSTATPSKPRATCGKISTVVEEFDEKNENDSDDAEKKAINNKDISPQKPLGKYQCLMCPYNKDSKHQLMRHLTKHFDDRPHKCPVCEKAFKSKDGLKIHIDCHMDIRPYPCLYCTYAATRSSNLKAHMRSHHREAQVNNAQPTTTLSKNEISYKSSSESTPAPSKTTSGCDKSPTAENLDSKIDELSGQNVNDSDYLEETNDNNDSDCVETEAKNNNKYQPKTLRKYQCLKCPYNNDNKYLLTLHLKTHIEGQTHKCFMCEKAFKRKSNLTIHIKKHMNIKPFQCVDCDKSFVTASILRTHRKQSHIGRKLLNCIRCDYTTDNRRSLKAHMNTHIYACTKCTYTSRYLHNLKSHEMRVHTGGTVKNVFQCKLCSVKLGTSVKLRVHMQNSHNSRKTHRCKHCNRSFILKGFLLRHMEIHQTNSDTINTPNSELKMNVRRTTRTRVSCIEIDEDLKIKEEETYESSIELDEDLKIKEEETNESSIVLDEDLKIKEESRNESCVKIDNDLKIKEEER